MGTSAPSHSARKYLQRPISSNVGAAGTAWISMVMVPVVYLNIFAVGIHGEAESIFASIKIIATVALLLFALIIDPGGGPTYDP